MLRREGDLIVSSQLAAAILDPQDVNFFSLTVRLKKFVMFRTKVSSCRKCEWCGIRFLLGAILFSVSTFTLA